MNHFPDRLFLKGLTFHGYHGTRPEEQSLGQRFQVDIEAFGHFKKAAQSDNLNDAINYINIHRIAQHLVEGTATNLLEALAELIASKILKNEPAEAVRVQIYKLSPYLGSASQGIAGVEIYRAKRN